MSQNCLCINPRRRHAQIKDFCRGLSSGCSAQTLSQAADFNLAGGSGTTAKVTVASGGVTLNVTGPALGAALDVTLSTRGLGVSTGLLDLPGIGDKESLTRRFRSR